MSRVVGTAAVDIKAGTVVAYDERGLLVPATKASHAEPRRCEWRDEDDDGIPFGHACAKPATHYSCCFGSGRDAGLNACSVHKCRCRQVRT